MRISGAKNITCSLGLLFFDAQSEESIKTYDANYASTDGVLCTGQSFTPDTDNAWLMPISVYIPNSAFAVYKSENDLICNFFIGRRDTNDILGGAPYYFKMKYINGQKTTEDY